MPHTFKDGNGKQFTIELTLGSVRMVRGKFALDLFNESDWTQLMSSLLDRLTYVWWLCKEQAEAYGYDIVAFDQALCSGNAANLASDAWLEELIVFYEGLSQVKLQKLTKAYLTGTQAERIKFGTSEFEDLLKQTLSGVTSSTPQAS